MPFFGNQKKGNVDVNDLAKNLSILESRANIGRPDETPISCALENDRKSCLHSVIKASSVFQPQMFFSWATSAWQHNDVYCSLKERIASISSRPTVATRCDAIYAMLSLCGVCDGWSGNFM